MISFSIHFLFCNVLISIMIGTILLAKKILRKQLSGGSQYHIWFVLPVILALPFLSVRPAGLSHIMHLLYSMQTVVLPADDAALSIANGRPAPSADWMNDFAVSVTGNSASMISCVPFVLWVTGMLAMIIFMIFARIRLCHLEQSALPLQNTEIRELYINCKAEMHIRRNIPVYSTAFLKSPIMAGMFRPRIYLPIHLIADFSDKDIRYMLLHELQHYRQKDAFINCLLNIAAIVYWFNPVVWYAIKEARTDREVACDTSVLQMLDASHYIDYGTTLLNFAQKISLSPFSLTTGIGGSTKQIKKRIINIARYQPQTKRHKIKERIVFAIMTVLILESTAFIPVMASNTDSALPEGAVIQTEDLSDYFADYEGCFVLYNTNTDTWDIYNEPLSTKRFAPDSTYKIYSALFALENQYIRPSSSTLAWDGYSYTYPEWNQDQDLASAMQSSVNWYFQTLDERAGLDKLQDFYRMIDYGNRDLSGGTSAFWMESSLKISAIEQVELLKKLYINDFHFDSHNIQAVKDSLKLSSSGPSVLSGKTGTGIIDGKSINGWFIGYVESDDNTWYFATNIHGTDHADSMTASKITLNILADKQIYLKEL